MCLALYSYSKKNYGIYLISCTFVFILLICVTFGWLHVFNLFNLILVAQCISIVNYDSVIIFKFRPYDQRIGPLKFILGI
jgi:hypothetical protein